MASRVRSGAIRLGRKTIFALGLAVILAVVLGVATTALAAVPGDPFRLGRINSIDRLSTLAGTTANAMLRVDNDGTGPALSLGAGANRPPIVVNAAAGTATNLDADQLDGQDSTDFLPAEIYEKSASQTISPDSSAGTTATCDTGDVAVSGSYAILGSRLDVTSERRVDDRFDEETGQTNPSGWHVIAENPDTSAEGTITVYVNCADRAPVHSP
ncbi:MAG TPA: hypothetical protein VHM69_03810 [Rubrobacter sp.]|nr:hypothetical protein [Rubrobacter sp.]